MPGEALTAKIITLGASLQDLRLAGHSPPLVLGFETLQAYEADASYIGRTVGRFANRIAGGTFSLDGQIVDLDRNDGANTLHGGSQGFSQRVWTIEDHGDDFVVLSLVSADGDMGFPGTMEVRCTYRIEANALSITLESSCDAPTVCSMTHHSYFNLDDGGRTPASDHVLRIAAERFLPVDQNLLPEGGPVPVAGTDFDFRSGRPIGDAVGYDHNYCLSEERRELRPVARLSAPASGIAMDLETTEPGLQFFSAAGLSCATPGLDGIDYAGRSGVCLEPQIWPDAPNRPEFPSAVLRPGSVYRHQSRYTFSKV